MYWWEDKTNNLKLIDKDNIEQLWWRHEEKKQPLWCHLLSVALLKNTYFFLRHTRSGAREATNVFSAFSYQKKSTLAKELKKSTFFSAFAERFFGHTMVHWKFISSGKLLNLKATHAKKPLWIILETCSQKELCDWNMLHKHWTFWVISTQNWSCQKGNTTSD